MAEFYDLAPIEDRTWIGAKPRTGSQFRAGWADTRKLLRDEIERISRRDAPRPILMLDITSADLRLDGLMRKGSRPATGAVALSFESKNGPLYFRCDRFVAPYYGQQDWHHNARAIALTLQSLRAVDRYGVTSSGEQYAGFAQIESASAAMDRDTAEVVLANGAGRGSIVNPSAAELAKLYRDARRKSHPDVPGGSRAQWDLVEEAGRALGLSS